MIALLSPNYGAYPKCHRHLSYSPPPHSLYDSSFFFVLATCSFPHFRTCYLLRPYDFELGWRMKKVGGISFGPESPDIGFLYDPLITLLFSELYRILLGFEKYVGCLHGIAARLPSHQAIFPSVTSRQDVPVHPPLPSVPVPGLCCRLRWLVDSYGPRLEI